MTTSTKMFLGFNALILGVMLISPLQSFAQSAAANPAINTVNPGTANPAINTVNPGTGGAETIKNPLNATDLPSLLNTVLGAVVTLGGIVVTLALIWIGFLFVSAQGNDAKLKTAKNALMYTLIGGLILLGAKAISSVLLTTATNLGS
jgi:hypothetical protein